VGEGFELVDDRLIRALDQLTSSILFTATRMVARRARPRSPDGGVTAPLDRGTFEYDEARSAVEAPVAMFLVYCTCPGQSR